MALFMDNLFVVLVPKTGTTALAKNLQGFSKTVLDTHITFEKLYKKFGEVETVSKIREPASWMESWWNYNNYFVKLDSKASSTGISYTNYAKKWIENGPLFPELPIFQHQYLLCGSKRVTHLFRYEDSQGFLKFLNSRLGLVVENKRDNISLRRKDVPTKEDRVFVNHLFKEDYDLWSSVNVATD